MSKLKERRPRRKRSYNNQDKQQRWAFAYGLSRKMRREGTKNQIRNRRKGN